MALPATDKRRITDEELLKISSANPNLRFELVGGELIAMPPVGEHSGYLEINYGADLTIWCRKHGGRSYSSSTGFKLPNGDVRSPDAAVVLPDNPAHGKNETGFVPGVPDFLIEVRSRSDSREDLEEKMKMWIGSGCRLALLIDPRKREAFVYRADGSITQYPYDATITGEDVLPGYAISPAEIDPK